MNKQNLMIDMDDVICNGGFLYLINEFTHKHYVIDDFKDYYMQDVIPQEDKKDWLEFFKQNNIYTKACFIQNAYEIIYKLNEVYNVFIVTSYIVPEEIIISSKLLQDKFVWLQENLPFISPYNYVFCSNKDIIDCDIKIDDKLSNLTGNIHTKTKLLFTAYHNKNITDNELKNNNVIRVNNWNDISEILL
ncbi:MAG: hypothetical protein RR290_01715 [Clostridia bacterium]